MDKLLEAFRLIDEIKQQYQDNHEIGVIAMERLESTLKSQDKQTGVDVHLLCDLQEVCETNLKHGSSDYEYFVCLMQIYDPDYEPSSTVKG